MPLTDTAARAAKPREKAYKLADSGGLHLFVTPTGGKLWRVKYRFGGKEKLLSLGPYPAVTLASAREKREEAKRLLREGMDPAAAKRASATAPGAPTFELIAREWYELNRGTWTKTHAGDVIGSLDRDVFPEIGNTPIGELTPPVVLGVLRAIEKRPAIETAHRVRQRMSAVFVFAIASGRGETDPAAIVKGALAPIRKGRQPAVTSLEKARQIIRDADAQTAHPTTKLALRLLALTALRPGSLITTPWSELEGVGEGETLWRVPAERMKMRLHHKDDEARDHIVPLSRQAVETIAALRSLNDRGPLVFPNTRHAHRPMSENAIGYLLNRAGYQSRHVPHGWRATFSTVMNERFPADRAVIDLMLAHVPKDRVERAYNRAAYLDRRIELAQEWADLLMVDQVPAADLIPMPRR